MRGCEINQGWMCLQSMKRGGNSRGGSGGWGWGLTSVCDVWKWGYGMGVHIGRGGVQGTGGVCGCSSTMIRQVGGCWMLRDLLN